MTAVPVGWPSGRGYWDQGWVEQLMAGTYWGPASHVYAHREPHVDPDGAEAAAGGVLVVAGRWWADRHGEVEAVVRAGPGRWLVVVTGDEQGEYPWAGLRDAGAAAVYVQTPRPDAEQLPGVRFVGDGTPPDCQPTLDALATGGVDVARPWGWTFAGQVVDHPRRQEAVAALDRVPDGRLEATSGFGEGLPYPAYLALLTEAKVAPAPAGPFSPDTFRLFEALEAGCIPVVDRSAHNVPVDGYWTTLWPDHPVPFPVLDSWDHAPLIIATLTHDDTVWARTAAQVGAWWTARKRDLAAQWTADLTDAGWPPNPPTTDGLVTVIVTVSPIGSHPGTAMIEETVASVRDRLPDAEILLACDGLPPGAEPGPYVEHLRRLVWLALRAWRPCLPLISDSWVHQAGTVAAALAHVRTPVVLMVEHDTPLTGDIPFPELVDAVQEAGLLVRLNHEDRILDVHRHLLVPDGGGGIVPVQAPLTATRQFSARPHLARTDWYTDTLARLVDPSSRCHVEDAFHGPAQSESWARWRIVYFAPPGNQQRSLHLDGRGGADKGPEHIVRPS